MLLQTNSNENDCKVLCLCKVPCDPFPTFKRVQRCKALSGIKHAQLGLRPNTEASSNSKMKWRVGCNGRRKLTFLVQGVIS